MASQLPVMDDTISSSPEMEQPGTKQLQQAAPTSLLTSFSSGLRQIAFAGVRTVSVFTAVDEELNALQNTAGVYDGGWRARFRITGEDRVRWLNGMVTNTVKDLQPGHLNYTFLLNAQGRIQGDGEVYALSDALLFATDRAQAARVQEQLNRFIIMDDVELAPEPDVTAIGIAGPQAAAMLQTTLETTLETNQFKQIQEGLLARESGDRYTLWLAQADAPAAWQRLLAAGATPCGIEAVEALRILSGTPRYGADIHDKSLAQETAQTRALNFNKGCYLGQEIVERIRSRATVHRGLRVFRLHGAVPLPGAALFAPEKPETPVGELTSITTFAGAEQAQPAGTYALGTIRTEAAAGSLHYDGGKATALPHAPLPGI